MAMKIKDKFNTKLGLIYRNDENFWKTLFLDYQNKSETLKTLSDKIGLDSRTIRNIFEEYEWIKSEVTHLKTTKGYLSKTDSKDWKKLHEMYLEGMSYEDVANYLGVQRKVVSKYFNLFGFSKRDMSESCKLGVSKMIKTCNDKFGVDFPTQNKEVMNKSKQTVMAKYNVDNIAKNPDIIHKIKQTNMNNYGVDWSFKNKDIRAKAEKTMIARYGHKIYTKSPEYVNSTLTKYTEIWKNRLSLNGYSLLDSFDGGKFKDNNNRRLFRKYSVKHLECGTVFNSTLQYTPTCPKCFNKSKSQIDLCNYIESLGFKTILNYKGMKDSKLEIDVFIPELNIGFEYNGLYWHTDKVRSKDYHRNKTNLCLENNIHLYHIWSSDSETIIKSKIRQILKVEKDIVRYKASRLSIKLVDSNVRRDFMETNHLHGDCNSSFSMGLFHDEELIQCISFKSINDIEMENARFATKLDTRVDFGFSKLLKHSIKYIKQNYPDISKIVTFAYRDWTPDYKDSVYYKCNFKFIKDSGAMMWYTDGRNLYNRQKFMKYKLKELFPETYDENLTEKEILALNGIYALYNSGNLKFEMEI